MSILARTVAAALMAFAALYVVMDEALTSERELALRLRASGEAVAARVATHQDGPRGSCNMALVGVTAAGLQFTARDSQGSSCITAPAVGTLRNIVVLRDDPTQFMHAEYLARRDAEGRTLDEALERWAIPTAFAAFSALLTALVGYVSQRRARRRAA